MNQNVEMARRSAARKLAPETINTSSFVRALLGYLLDERWTYPHIVHLGCHPDGTLLALESDSGTHLRLLCRRKDLIAAILILTDLVELTPGERTYLLSKVPEPAKSAQRNGN